MSLKEFGTIEEALESGEAKFVVSGKIYENVNGLPRQIPDRGYLVQSSEGTVRGMAKTESTTQFTALLGSSSQPQSLDTILYDGVKWVSGPKNQFFDEVELIRYGSNHFLNEHRGLIAEGPDGNIYFIPSTGSTRNLVVYNIYTKGGYVLSGFIPSGSFRFLNGAIPASNGKIYLSPFNHDRIGAINTNTHPPTYENIGDTTVTGYRGAVRVGDKIFFIPNNATSIAVLDVADNESISFHGDFLGSSKWADGILAPNGKIYCIPHAANNILVITPDSPEDSYIIDDGPSIFSSDKGNLTIGPDGMIYFVNVQSTSFIYMIDPENDTYTRFEYGSNVNYGGCVTAPNGKIYLIPHRANNVGIFDPIEKTLDRISLFVDVPVRQYMNAILAEDGNIYCGFHTQAQTADIMCIKPRMS